MLVEGTSTLPGSEMPRSSVNGDHFLVDHLCSFWLMVLAAAVLVGVQSARPCLELAIVQACVKTCAEECQPCIDDGWWCAKWLCPVNGKSCRKTCAEHCAVNCKETPDLGECKARAAACELSEAMAEWKSAMRRFKTSKANCGACAMESL